MKPVNAIQLKTYTAKERLMYLIGLVGQNMIYNIVNVLLASYFLQNVLYIPPLAFTSIIVIARIWDAFNDPIMGTIVDRTRTKWGKCRPYLLFSPLPIYIITCLCFVNGTYDPNMPGLNLRNVLIVVWAGVSYIMWGMAYTIGDIPLWGISALLTEDTSHREKLLSLARMFAGIGAGVATLALQPLAIAVSEMFEKHLGNKHEGERYGYLLVAVGVGFIAYVTFQMAGIFTKEKIAPSKETYTVKQNFKIMWRNKPFRQILLSGVLAGPKNTLMIVAFPLVTFYYANKDDTKFLIYMGLIGGALFLGQFLAMQQVPRLLLKYSKKNLYNYSNLLAVLPCILLFIMFLMIPDKMADPVPVGISMILFGLNGVSLGITTVLQSLMIADAVDYEEYTYGVRTDGVFFSGQTFIAKISSSIAQAIYGLACFFVGYSSAEAQHLQDFFEIKNVPILRDAMLTTHPQFYKYVVMFFAVAAIPAAIGSILTVIPTWNYCLDDDDHDKMVDELNKKRHENDITEEA